MKDEGPYSRTWFKAQFLKTATSQAELFHHLNEAMAPKAVSRDKVNKMVNGKRKPQPDELPHIWKFFDIAQAGINAVIALDGAADKHEARISEIEFGKLQNFPRTGPKDLPVMQTAEGGDDGDLLLTNDILEWVRRPASLEGQLVFAAYIAGDSMSPRYEPGEPVYAYYSRPITPGDYVILELKPRPGSSQRRGFIKRFIRKSAKTWICEQFLPPKEVVFSASEIVRAYRVVPPSELFG